MEGSVFVCHLHDEGHNILVIFLTAKNKEKELEEGFGSGGDDYMTKPFSHKELLLRVKALLRRSGVSQAEKVKFRDIKPNLTKRKVEISGEVVNLTNLEFKLLCTFVKNPNNALEREYLRDEVWGEGSEDFHDKTIKYGDQPTQEKDRSRWGQELFCPGMGYKLQ